MRRILALLLALLTVVSLAACSKSEADSSQPTSAETGQTAPEEGGEGQDNTPMTKPPFKTVYYWVEKKVTNGNATSVYSRSYDAKGNLLTDSYRPHNNVGGYSYTYTYDESGKCLTEAGEDQNGSWSIEYTYDESGKPDTKTTETIDGLETVKYSYDASGKLIKGVQVLSKDSQIVTEYTYSRKGYLVKEQTSVIRGDATEIREAKEYLYDINGNIASCSIYEGTELISKQLWSYDEKGRLATEVTLNSEDKGKGVSYTYGKFDRILMTVTGTFLNTEIQSIEAYEELIYDERQLLGRRICYGADENPTGEYEYTYDSHGNLVKEKLYRYKDNKMSVTEYTYIGVEMPNE